MAVYTKVTEVELSKFLGDYNLGEIISFEGIQKGTENSNFILKTSLNLFILTLFEKRTKSQDLPFYLGLMSHLYKSGISCPKPLTDKKGEMVKQLCGRPAVIVSYLRGSEVKLITPEHCTQLGIELGKIHTSGLNLSAHRENDFSVKSWLRVAQKVSFQIEKFDVGLRQEIFSGLAIFEKDWPQNLPKGFIHGDLFPDNVFFEENKISGIFDFYFSCTDSFAYDISICINAWCFNVDETLNFDKVECLLNSYQLIRNLSREEREALPILASGSAMRFFLTRFYDWINHHGNALIILKNPTEYLSKMRFHRDSNWLKDCNF